MKKLLLAERIFEELEQNGLRQPNKGFVEKINLH